MKNKTKPCSLRVAKLIDRIQQLARILEMNQDFRIHQKIDQFYYMQKCTELATLREHVEETMQRAWSLAGALEKEYTQVFRKWAGDVRLLNALQQQHDDRLALRREYTFHHAPGEEE